MSDDRNKRQRERLRAALRENLKRRKARARAAGKRAATHDSAEIAPDNKAG